MRGAVFAALVALLLGTTFRVQTASAEVCDNCHGPHGPGQESRSFHVAGAAHCDMCHTMHNSQDGAPVDPDSPAGNPWLLRDGTPSDVCLSCHADGISHVFSPDPNNPQGLIGAGDFVYLLEDNLNDGHGGGADPIPGSAAGHNIQAPSRGVGADGTLIHSPGGSFPAASLGCTSCHDPHGNTSFRMLHGTGSVQNGLFVFTAPAPDALGRSIYHGFESHNRHSAYRAGMSEWCGNCHGEFHDHGGTLRHPSGSSIGSAVAEVYNRYNGTDDPYGGVHGTALLTEVPFEDPMNNTTSRRGPSAESRVVCTTCHRAHASSAPDAGRWDFRVTFLADDGAESGSYPIADPYGSPNQRSLCNKCHHKDYGDGPR